MFQIKWVQIKLCYPDKCSKREKKTFLISKTKQRHKLKWPICHVITGSESRLRVDIGIFMLTYQCCGQWGWKVWLLLCQKDLWLWFYTPCVVLMFLFSPLPTVHEVPFYPVADLSIFQRCDSHRYIKFLGRTLSLYPLMPGKHTYHLPLPASAPTIPHPRVDSRAASPGLSVAVLVQQVWSLLAGTTEPIHQLSWPVVIESWEVDSATRQSLSGGADSQLHVAPFVGFLEFKQSIVIVHSYVISIPFYPAFGNVGALGSDPLELHYVTGRWCVGTRTSFNMVGEVGGKVEGRLLCVSLLRF